MTNCPQEGITELIKTTNNNNNSLPPQEFPITSMPEYLYHQSFHQFIPQCSQLTSTNPQNLSNPPNYQNYQQNLQEPQLGQNQPIHSNSGILPSFNQEIPNSSQLTLPISSTNFFNSQNPPKSSSQNLNESCLAIQRLSPNSQQQQQSSINPSHNLQISQQQSSQQFNNSTGNNQQISNTFSTNFPFWLDYQNPSNQISDNSTNISTDYYPPPFTSIAAAFDYNNNAGMMGMLPSMYPQNFQILDEQQSSQYFSVGGLYDSLAAAAAIAAGQIGDPSQITNFCWPTFDYYGGGQNSSSTINWTHWGYPTIDSNNVGELIQQQNHSAVESGGSLSIFDSIAPIIEGSTEIKSQINSNKNQNEWQKTLALAATTSTTSTNNNRQLTSKFVSKRGREEALQLL
uniref:Uncharacterized protein n=1 Tax=Meloidogyne enterolobii TaxID=390850 RepID=A0A6V7V1G8_MELEN|nr:unnamed protein product [Meloidogyne enterolobii]